MTIIPKLKGTIGHEKQKRLFIHANTNNRVSHAYLFAGPIHIGKTTFAKELAVEVLGCEPVLDLYIHDQTQGVNIETVRELQHHLSLSSSGLRKVAVITHAERMSDGAANALLKLLEEPPRHAVIILITSNPHSLLPTISSRLQHVYFSYASEEELDEAVKRFGVDKSQIDLFKKRARGRIGVLHALVHDESYKSFCNEADLYFEVLLSGNVLKRAQAAEFFAKKNTDELGQYLVYWMQQLTSRAHSHVIPHGVRLVHTFSDLRYNVNSRLVADQLFLQ